MKTVKITTYMINKVNAPASRWSTWFHDPRATLFQKCSYKNINKITQLQKWSTIYTK